MTSFGHMELRPSPPDRLLAEEEPAVYTSIDTAGGAAAQGRWRQRALAAAGALSACAVVAGMVVPRSASVADVAAGSPGTVKCATVVETHRDSGHRLSEVACASFQADYSAHNSIDITASASAQEVVGFGGAFTESSALTWQGLPPDVQKEFVEAYFHPEKGIGFSLGRVHINSCDFSINSYSFDDVPEDYDLKYFDDSVHHDTRTMIPLIKAAFDEAGDRPIRMLASPWSPPAWMKREKPGAAGKMDSSEKPGLRPECHDVWARYMSRWISAYEKHDVPIWAVTFQNEPENAAAWEACVYTPQEQAEWVRNHLGPVLRKDHPDVKIFAFDHNKDHLWEWANASFGDAETSRYFDGIAFHWYSGDEFDHVAAVHATWPDKLLLPSEATYEKYRWHKGTTLDHGDWTMGEGYAHDVIGDLNEGAIGWLDWNLLLDAKGGPNHLGNDCDAAIMANVTAGKMYKHPQYFFLGHFSKYILPGSKVLRTKRSYRNSGPRTPVAHLPRPYGTCDGEFGLESVSALRPDGQVAVVVLNCGDQAIGYKIKNGDKALSMTVLGHSIQTVLLPYDPELMEVASPDEL